jgi:hypothetical protein
MGVNGEGRGMGDSPVCPNETEAAESKIAHAKIRYDQPHNRPMPWLRRSLKRDLRILFVN